MMRSSLRIACAAICSTALLGCSWSSSPYARDPLVQKKRAVPGGADIVPALCASDHPAPPIPPPEAAVIPFSK